MTLTVSFDDLSIGWPNRTLMENVSGKFDLEAWNYTLPIIGRTGRGKSTLLYALSGMSLPLSGSVAWRLPEQIGWTAQSMSSGSFNDVRRQKFGFLLQDATMIPCFTVAENLRHILRLRGITTDAESRIGLSIERMLIRGETVGDFRDKFPTQLSGGMRQRMALAASIAHDPQVLFADEPTASLDDETGMEVLGVVRRWLDERAGTRAFVFVTHRVETLREGARATQMLQLDTVAVGDGQRVVHHPRPIA
ncbi:MAG TPA: ATP-binding cassette domain-containing protein [Bradyrhizobium sp.]|nr:ATP-binding cassette domain-containing protein [Bradyrhizobium sp.]